MNFCCVRPPSPAGAVLILLAASSPFGTAAAPEVQLLAGVPTQESSDGRGDGLSKDDSPSCMRCHWMETMAYRDRDTGEIVNLSIHEDRYRHSVHADLACRDCHDRGYVRYPHRSSSADEDLRCVDCHETHQQDGVPSLADLDAEYQKSVHVAQGIDDFSCASCHDPHRFRPPARDDAIAEVVAQSNGTCLECHAELLTPVPRGHGWLPRPHAHWSAVRCLDCHTPLAGRVPERPSHHVLPAADSNRLCVECHSQGANLLSQLYNYRVHQVRERDGFFAQAFYNDAYIVGMSRNRLLDWISLAVIGLTLLAVVAHGAGRYIAYRKRERSR